MKEYVPFLKLKQGEVLALGELDESLLEDFLPFFDIARGKPGEQTGTLESRIARACKQLLDQSDKVRRFYLDDFDLPEDTRLGSQSCYEFALERLSTCDLVPVVGTDRSEARIDFVLRQKQSGRLSSNVVAVRVQLPGLRADAVTGRLDALVTLLESAFDEVHLVLDCRVVDADTIRGFDSSIQVLIERLGRFARVIVAGSIIPASIRDLSEPSHDTTLERHEVDLYLRARTLMGRGVKLFLGDYGVISPDYSDAEFAQTVFRKVTAPKVIYSFDKRQHLRRGSSLESGGNGQYRQIFRKIIDHESGFFRGEDYSWGDRFMVEKARGEGKDVTPASVIKPLTVAHLTFMLRDFSV